MHILQHTWHIAYVALADWQQMVCTGSHVAGSSCLQGMANLTPALYNASFGACQALSCALLCAGVARLQLPPMDVTCASVPHCAALAAARASCMEQVC